MIKKTPAGTFVVKFRYPKYEILSKGGETITLGTFRSEEVAERELGDFQWNFYFKHKEMLPKSVYLTNVGNNKVFVLKVRFGKTVKTIATTKTLDEIKKIKRKVVKSLIG